MQGCPVSGVPAAFTALLEGLPRWGLSPLLLNWAGFL